MLRKLSWIMVVLLGVFLGQCTNDNGPVSPNDPVRNITPSEKTLIESSNEFGLRLFREITSTEGNTNVFISPLSVSMALGMTYNGADGKTREEMADLLGLSGMTITEANQAYQSLIELLHGLDPEVAFSIANSIWLRQDFPVKEEFIDLNQTFFDAEVTTLDFGDPGAKDTINNWVDMKTNGKIPRIVDNINPLTMLFLINAIYFKGNWTQMFDSLGTHEEDFITVDGTKTLCNMMSQENTFPYFANDTFQAIDLTYGNGDFSMAIILPRHGVELDSLIEEFTPENWDTWRGSFVESEVQSSLRWACARPLFHLWPTSQKSPTSMICISARCCTRLSSTSTKRGPKPRR